MTKTRSFLRYALILIMAAALSGCPLDEDENRVAHGSTSQSNDPAAVNDDLAQVTVAITAPISSSSMDTTDKSVSLAGTASSELGIYKVTWSTDRGPAGIASGKELWRAEGVPLELGDNTITVTAEDTTGASNSRSVKVRRESGQQGSVTLSWTPPTAREDGTPLTNLAGYKIYYGRMSGVYDYQIDVDSPGVSTYVVEQLVSGEWFFSLAAYDADGLESDRSNEVVRDIS
jgi:hypothetical protein